jgi:hypothetical protein
MSVQSSRQSILQFTGDVTGTEIAQAAVNQLSSAQSQIIALIIGANTITVPVVALVYVPTAVTIVPDPLNVFGLVLKGVTGDTGVKLHATDPSIVALDPSVVSFVLTVQTPLNVRFIWS